MKQISEMNKEELLKEKKVLQNKIYRWQETGSTEQKIQHLFMRMSSLIERLASIEKMEYLEIEKTIEVIKASSKRANKGL